MSSNNVEKSRSVVLPSVHFNLYNQGKNVSDGFNTGVFAKVVTFESGAVLQLDLSDFSPEGSERPIKGVSLLKDSLISLDGEFSHLQIQFRLDDLRKLKIMVNRAIEISEKLFEDSL